MKKIKTTIFAVATLAMLTSNSYAIHLYNAGVGSVYEPQKTKIVNLTDKVVRVESADNGEWARISTVLKAGASTVALISKLYLTEEEINDAANAEEALINKLIKAQEKEDLAVDVLGVICVPWGALAGGSAGMLGGPAGIAIGAVIGSGIFIGMGIEHWALINGGQIFRGPTDWEGTVTIHIQDPETGEDIVPYQLAKLSRDQDWTNWGRKEFRLDMDYYQERPWGRICVNEDTEIFRYGKYEIEVTRGERPANSSQVGQILVREVDLNSGLI